MSLPAISDDQARSAPHHTVEVASSDSPLLPDAALAEAVMLRLPQVECPVSHHFGPGVYIREAMIPAGTLALGHAQRFEQLNVMLRGRMAVPDGAGGLRELRAPLIFVGPPGRKAGLALEDVVWLNVYATDERDIDKLEAMFFERSDAWCSAEAEQHQLAVLRHAPDREDYARVLDEAGIGAEAARAQAENEADLIDMPASGARVRIAPSPIEGRGVFVTSPVEAGELIAPARIGGRRTPAGRFTNHSCSPNARMVLGPGGDIDLVATRRISGCLGGGAGEEVTIDYRQALALSGINCIKEAA